MNPFWVSAFLDFADPDVEVGTTFWSAVTGYDVSPARGGDDEFATLVPPVGDDFLRVQRQAESASRLHLDLHVRDPSVATTWAERLGASVVVRHHLGYVVLVSPAGITFCLVTHPAGTRPPPAAWPDGHRSIIDQVALDIAPSAYDLECTFWRDLTGWDLRASPSATEFSVLGRGPGQPLRFLLHRLGEERHPAGAHLDLATDDRTAEVARQEVLGARVHDVREQFTVLHDPAGLTYCVTDRDPDTGMLR